MKSIQLNSCKNQGGFTLVELAIVMVIIGLLITGILKGQEMIANAQVTSTIAAAKGIDAATSTFRDMYSAFPGDMAAANTRLPGCTAAPCWVAGGTANGKIDQGIGVATATNQESAYYFNQMQAVDLLSGFDGSNTPAFGNALPTAPLGGGWKVGHSVPTAGGVGASFGATPFRPGHYLILSGTTGADTSVAPNFSGLVTTKQAGQIDRKMDDGKSVSGFVYADLSVGNAGTAGCRDGVAAPDTGYNEVNSSSVCTIAIRVQG